MERRLTDISFDDVLAFINSEPCRIARALGPDAFRTSVGSSEPAGISFCVWVDAVTFDAFAAGGARMRIAALQAPTGNHVGAIELRSDDCSLIIVGDRAAHRAAFSWALEAELLQLMLFDGQRIARASWDLPLAEYRPMLEKVRDAVLVSSRLQYIGVAMAAVSCKELVALESKETRDGVGDVTVAVLTNGDAAVADGVASPPSAARHRMH